MEGGVAPHQTLDPFPVASTKAAWPSAICFSLLDRSLPASGAQWGVGKHKLAIDSTLTRLARCLASSVFAGCCIPSGHFAWLDQGRSCNVRNATCENNSAVARKRWHGSVLNANASRRPARSAAVGQKSAMTKNTGSCKLAR